MKKLLYIFLMLSLVLSLYACKIGGDGDEGSGDSGYNSGTGDSGTGDNSGSGDSSDGVIPERYVFAPGTAVTVVTDGEYAETERLIEKIEGATGVAVTVTDNTSIVKAHEIVIGQSSREISKLAYRYLERIKEYREGY
ncbi:MAG: hypothetical protein J6C39_00660, partial [Clostridia bacterium]|nr:hypothetical protein [Clostridia bacterium]